MIKDNKNNTSLLWTAPHKNITKIKVALCTQMNVMSFFLRAPLNLNRDVEHLQTLGIFLLARLQVPASHSIFKMSD